MWIKKTPQKEERSLFPRPTKKDSSTGVTKPPEAPRPQIDSEILILHSFIKLKSTVMHTFS